MSRTICSLNKFNNNGIKKKIFIFYHKCWINLFLNKYTKCCILSTIFWLWGCFIWTNSLLGLFFMFGRLVRRWRQKLWFLIRITGFQLSYSVSNGKNSCPSVYVKWRFLRSSLAETLNCMFIGLWQIKMHLEWFTRDLFSLSYELWLCRVFLA